ncbi:type II RES/Xre toxin-antitoxin system antitoxin [Dongshaea marina]|uniref:type II RES/Xre toxin-antitoxin system antitoxin n=1 Tax=Dongshaea marina TaxID=2047966 RepID=UPI000D3E557A|nr:antitoxin Xre/MbcA/ParS toxin-binding domain-containing protein [Dongshaea marina]
MQKRTFIPSKAVIPRLWRDVGLPAGHGLKLVMTINDGLSCDVLDRLSEAVGEPKEAIYKMTQLSKRTLARRLEQGVLKPDESDRVVRFIRVFDRATELFNGDRALAMNWLKEPARALGGKTPVELMTSESGAIEVFDLIGRIEHGVFS